MIRHYSLIPRLEKALRTYCCDYSPEIESVPPAWSEFPLTCLCFETQNVHNRDGAPLWDENAISYTIDILYAYYRSLVDTINLGASPSEIRQRFVGVYVQPDLHNQSSVIITQRALNHLVYLADIKIRHFCFDTPENMETDMAQELATIVSGLK